MISILLPTYNCATYLQESIDSLLAQTYTDWELILVDDGSTDHTTRVVYSYNDPRIKYIYHEHEGISAALNFGLSQCTGEYVARMDADDICHQDRLQVQLDYLETHTEVDLVGTGMKFFGGNSNRIFSLSGAISKEMMLKGCCICHASIMMRGELAKQISYSSDFPDAEDYHLWLSLLDQGVVMHNLPNVLYYYRQHSNQTSSLRAEQQFESAQRAIANHYNESNSTILQINDSDLTLIIPFRNEGDEIERTVQSVRNTASCNILLIDDASDDDFDYKSIADRYHCRYYRNRISLGTGGARDLGVSLCNSPYFVQIDGHMRFYDKGWDDRLLEVLQTNPKALVCSNTIAFTRDKNGLYNNEDGATGREQFKSHGAVINLTQPGWEMTARWYYAPDSGEVLRNIPAVMGAVYASSKEWWKHIRGLHGTIGYGADEPLMSIKSFLAGGEVLIMDQWGVGHLYREKQPYQMSFWKMIYNTFYTILLLCPDREKEYLTNYRKRVGDTVFLRAMNEIEKNRSDIDAHRSFLEKQVFIRSFEEFEQFNLSFCLDDSI